MSIKLYHYVGLLGRSIKLKTAGKVCGSVGGSRTMVIGASASD